MAERCPRILSDDRQCSNPKAPGREFCALHNPMVRGADPWGVAHNVYNAWCGVGPASWPPWESLPHEVRNAWRDAVAAVWEFECDEELTARALALRAKLLREIVRGSPCGFSHRALDIIVEALKHEHDLANGED